ncbi:hypothetical protein V490_03071 [Pseudogymnoascus sp. VKM F-3557]|nr:hypothetical protein V490_03071 [Pseudogymnoascus sp. VKM F-3557]
MATETVLDQQNGADITVPTNGSAKAKTATVDASIALSPCDIDAVPGLLSQITKLSNGSLKEDKARLEMLDNARALVRVLETPRETMIKHTWAQNTNFAAIAFGVETGLWIQIVNNGDSPQKVVDLSKQLGLDPTLLARMLKHICAMGYIVETGPDEYTPNNFTKSLSLPIIAHSYPVCLWSVNTALVNLHKYLKEIGYQNPTSPTDGNYQRAHNTSMDFFAHLQANPPAGERFNNLMGGYRQGRPSWMDKGFFPVRERLLDGFEGGPDAALLVDIGGNVGHDLDEFRRKFPDSPGRLVLQDLQRVLDQIEELDSKIERCTYDFYEENPVKGARAYYVHTMLHDWPDELCVKILARIKEAMKPGYSRLLINEQVIPPTGAHWEATCLDVLMMNLFSAKERTEADWHHLVETLSGLRIVKFWSVGNGVENLIEVVRDE